MLHIYKTTYKILQHLILRHLKILNKKKIWDSHFLKRFFSSKIFFTRCNKVVRIFFVRFNWLYFISDIFILVYLLEGDGEKSAVLGKLKLILNWVVLTRLFKQINKKFYFFAAESFSTFDWNFEIYESYWWIPICHLF